MHNLDFSEKKGTVSFATAKVSAWHQLGQVVDHVMTTSEAIELANLDFQVSKQPLYTKYGKTNIVIPNYIKKGNKFLESNYDFEIDKYNETDNTFATIREDTGAVLGIVGDKYDVLQNREAFNFFDPLLEEGEAFIETAGALGKGERIFITAKMPDHISIFGKEDIIEQYLLITTAHDGKTATTIMFTPVRVVCQNTLNIALKSKTPNRVSIKHTEKQLNRIEKAHNILKLQNNYRKEIEEIFGILAETKADEAMYERIIVSGLADNPKMVKNYFNPKGKPSTRFNNNVEACMNYAYSHPSQLMPSTHNTLFGAMNAISGYYQNEVTWGNEDSKMRSIIDTNGRVNLKQQQALEAVLSVVKKRTK